MKRHFYRYRMTHRRGQPVFAEKPFPVFCEGRWWMYDAKAQIMSTDDDRALYARR